jgi:PAS domain S-box-containing protein
LKHIIQTEATMDLKPVVTEPAFEPTESLFRAIANSIPQLAWVARADGYVVWYNQRWFEYTGTTPQDVQGWGWQSVHHPGVLPAVLVQWQDSIALGEPFDMEYPLKGADGVFRVFVTRVLPINDSEGQVIHWFGTNSDLGEGLLRQQALQDSAETYRMAIKATNAAIWDLNLENDSVHWNDAFAVAFGQPPSTGDCHEWWEERIYPADREETLQSFRIAMAGPENGWTGEYRFRRADGRWANLSDRGYFLRDKSGKPLRMVRALMDFTERKSAELRNVQLAAMVDAAQDAIIVKSLDGTISSWNGGAQRLFGYTSSEMIGQRVMRLLPPGQHEEESRILARLGRGDRIEPYETVRCHKDGRLVEVSVSVSPIRDGHGRIVGASKIARDITELKRREAAMQQAHEELREQAKVLEMAQGLVRGMDNRIVQWNMGAERLYGFSKEEVLGRVSHELFRTEFPQPLAEIEEILLRTGLWEGELVHRRRNGDRLVVASQWVLHRNSAGIPVHVLEVDTDITERMAAQKALEIRNTDLQQFAYIASHDLKTPLRTISGFVELLQVNYAGQLDAQGADWIRRASEGAHRLEARIDNLLLYSRLDSRAAPFEPVDCRAVLAETLEALESVIRETGAEVTADQLPIVMGDSSQLVQLFQNLIGNGIQYRGPTRPRIHVSAKRTNGDWLFSIADNGIGIHPQYHERIFELFRRLHSQKAYPGDGIGLTLCRRVVGRHGGRIWIESEPGRGCTIFFTLFYLKDLNP